MKKYKPGQPIYINLATRKIDSMIISEDPNKKNYYFLDWTVSGRDKILNTVPISFSVITLRKIEKIKNDNFAEQTIEM